VGQLRSSGLYPRVLACEDVRVVGATTAGSFGDQGIDVIETLARPGLLTVRLAVQAKRMTGEVGRSVVTQLRGGVPQRLAGSLPPQDTSPEQPLLKPIEPTLTVPNSLAAQD
jgi:hypothetical protein